MPTKEATRSSVLSVHNFYHFEPSPLRPTPSERRVVYGKRRTVTGQCFGVTIHEGPSSRLSLIRPQSKNLQKPEGSRDTDHDPDSISLLDFHQVVTFLTDWDVFDSLTVTENYRKRIFGGAPTVNTEHITKYGLITR